MLIFIFDYFTTLYTLGHVYLLISEVFRLVIFYLSFVVFQDSCCDEYIEQLIPQTTPIGKIKVKVFGHSGVGKTTLIESLRAGYFSGLFRRSKSKTSTVIGSANGKFLFVYFT